MRGDAGLTARLLLRGAGLAGMVTAGGGAIVIAGSLRPWYAIVAEVSMLGGTSERTVAALRGIPGTWGGWTVGGLGVLVVVLGMLVALDRTPARGRHLAIGIGCLILAVAAVATVTVPAVGTIASGTSEPLLAVRDHLPVGVELELRAIRTSGPWWVMGGAGIAIAGTAAARDR